MTARPTAQHQLRRRTVTGAAAVGLGVPVLAACSGDGSGDVATDPSTPSEQGGPVAQASDIEVGGGTILPDRQIVITQPDKGEFKCFTAVCTHAGCIVSSVAGGNINCRCHGSAFSIADGSVVNGPATQPLAEQAISVEGGAITLG